MNLSIDNFDFRDNIHRKHYCFKINKLSCKNCIGRINTHPTDYCVLITCLRKHEALKFNIH